MSTDSRPYSIEYAGKRSDIQILSSPPAKLELVSSTAEASNLLCHGENLDVMSALLADKSVRGKLRFAYLDPPFSTGFSFESRNQTLAYTDTLGGAAYLEFLRTRLILTRELLADDGSIYVHLDGNMAFAAKLLLDEIFGAKNFRNFITRKKSNPKNYTRKQYGNTADYIIFYTKSQKYVWNQQFTDHPDEAIRREYRHIEPSTGRHFMKVPIHAPGTRNGATGKEWHGMLPPPGKHWQYTPEKLDQFEAAGELCWSANGNPRRKVYLDERAGVPVQDIWLDYKDAHNQNIMITGYPTEKNLSLIIRLVQASSNPGDLIIDPFIGSGTTAVAAGQLGRRWIGIDSSVEAITTTLKRLFRGSKKMGDYVKKDTTQAKLLEDPFDAPRDGVAVYRQTNSAYLNAPPDAIEQWRTELIPI